MASCGKEVLPSSCRGDGGGAETRRGAEERKKRSVDRESPLEERFADGVAIREVKGRIGGDSLSSGSRGIIRRSITSMVLMRLIKHY